MRQTIKELMLIGPVLCLVGIGLWQWQWQQQLQQHVHKGQQATQQLEQLRQSYIERLAAWGPEYRNRVQLISVTQANSWLQSQLQKGKLQHAVKTSIINDQQIRLNLTAVSFNRLLRFIPQLQQGANLRLQKADITATDKAGQVNAILIVEHY